MTYLDTELFIDLEDLSENIDILHEIGKLPAVPQAREQAWLLGLLLGLSLHFGVGTLSRHHGGGSRASGAAPQGWFPQLFFPFSLADGVAFKERIRWGMD